MTLEEQRERVTALLQTSEWKLLQAWAQRRVMECQQKVMAHRPADTNDAFRVLIEGQAFSRCYRQLLELKSEDLVPLTDEEQRARNVQVARTNPG